MKTVNLYKGYAIFRGILMFAYAALMLVIGFVGRNALNEDVDNNPIAAFAVSLVGVLGIILIIAGFIVAIYFVLYVIGVKRTLSGNGKGKVFLALDCIINFAYAALAIASFIIDDSNASATNGIVIIVVSAIGLVYDVLAIIAIKELNFKNS